MQTSPPASQVPRQPVFGAALSGLIATAALLAGLWSAWSHRLPITIGPEPDLPDTFQSRRDLLIGWTDPAWLQPERLQYTHRLVERLRQVPGVRQVVSAAGSAESIAMLQTPIVGNFVISGAERSLVSSDRTRCALLCRLEPHAEAPWPAALAEIERLAREAYPDCAIVGYSQLAWTSLAERWQTALARSCVFLVIAALLLPWLLAISRSWVIIAVAGLTVAAVPLFVQWASPDVADVLISSLPLLVSVVSVVGLALRLPTAGRPAVNVEASLSLHVNTRRAGLLKSLAVVGLIIAAIAVSVLGAARLQLIGGARRVAPASHRLCTDWDFMNAHFGGTRYSYATLPVPADYSWDEYDQLRRLQDRFRAIAGVRHVAGLADLLQALVGPVSRLLPAGGVFGELQRRSPETVEYYRLSTPAATTTRLLIFCDPDASAAASSAVHRKLDEACRSEFPGGRIEGLAAFENQLLLEAWTLLRTIATWALPVTLVFGIGLTGFRRIPWLAWFATVGPTTIYFGALGWLALPLTNDRLFVGAWLLLIGVLVGSGWIDRIRNVAPRGTAGIAAVGYLSTFGGIAVPFMLLSTGNSGDLACTGVAAAVGVAVVTLRCLERDEPSPQ